MTFRNSIGGPTYKLKGMTLLKFPEALYCKVILFSVELGAVIILTLSLCIVISTVSIILTILLEQLIILITKINQFDLNYLVNVFASVSC